MNLARVPITTDTSPQVWVPLEPLRQTSRRGLLRSSDDERRQTVIRLPPYIGIADTVARVYDIGRARGADDAPRSAVMLCGGSFAVRNLERRPRPRVGPRVVQCEKYDEYDSERRGEAAPFIARVAVLFWPRRPRVVGYDAAEH